MTIATYTLGQQGLHVPMLGFGTAPLAVGQGWRGGDPILEAQALAALHFAYEQGIRLFDTAPAYVKGLAEKRTGKFLRQVARDTFVLATKVGVDIDGQEVHRDYSRDGVLRSLEGSLKRLQVDRIDIVHVHDADHHAQQVLDETFPTLAELREQGVIRSIGIGMNQWQVPQQLVRHADFDCVMIAGRFTLLEQGAQSFFDECYAKGITVFAASIYNSGILATGAASLHSTYNHTAAPSAIVEKVRRLEAVCGEFDVSLHTAATQFPMLHPAVKTLVVGFQHRDEVATCLAALTQPIPPILWERLHDEGLLEFLIPTPSAKVNPL